MLVTLFRKKLAFRSAVIILGAVMLLGLLVVTVETVVAHRAEQAAQERQLHSLLNTVLNTTQVAVFLGDDQLAKEIAEGLAGNDIVAEVTIRSGDRKLAQHSKPTASGDAGLFGEAPQVLSRAVENPFVPGEIVGDITLVSNPVVIAEKLRQSAKSTVLVQLAEILLAGLCTILVVMWLITQPITSISNRLHRLNVTLGEKIPLPSIHHRKDEIGQLVHDVNVMIDRVVALLANERSLRGELEANERKFRSIFENATSAIFLVDAGGVLLSYNSAFLQLFHVSSRVIDRHPSIYELVGDYDEKLRTLIARALADNSSEEIEIVIEADKQVWIKMVLSPGQQGTVQVVANEITAFKQAYSAVEKEITTDPLTGIGNRRGVERRLATLLDPTQQRVGSASALFFMDLDHFKEVNDSYGHQAGDAVLIRVAEIIQAQIRKTDYSARSGGDEFIVVLDNMDDRETCERIAGALLREIEKPMTLGPQLTVTVGVSIGIAFGKPGIVTPEELMKLADAAMYQAKENGRHQYCFSTAGCGNRQPA